MLHMVPSGIFLANLSGWFWAFGICIALEGVGGVEMFLAWLGWVRSVSGWIRVDQETCSFYNMPGHHVPRIFYGLPVAKRHGQGIL